MVLEIWHHIVDDYGKVCHLKMKERSFDQERGERIRFEGKSGLFVSLRCREDLTDTEMSRNQTLSTICDRRATHSTSRTFTSNIGCSNGLR